jgi:hypothetical protein
VSIGVNRCQSVSIGVNRCQSVLQPTDPIETAKVLNSLSTHSGRSPPQMLVLLLPLIADGAVLELAGTTTSSISMNGAQLTCSARGRAPHVRYLSGGKTKLDISQSANVSAILGNVLTSCVDAGYQPCASLDPDEDYPAFFCHWKSAKNDFVTGPLHASRSYDDPACTQLAAGCPLRIFVVCPSPSLAELGAANSDVMSASGYSGSLSLALKHYLKRTSTSTYEADATSLQWMGVYTVAM